MKKHIISKPIHLFWIVLIVVSPLGACQKEKLPDEISTLDDAYRAIVGEWEWERTEISSRGLGTTVYQTPDTENKTLQETFLRNRKSYRVETTDKVSARTDYEYNITIDVHGGDGYGAIFFLTSTNINTNEKHQSIFRFKNKDTLVYFLRSPFVEFYYVRK